MIFNPRRYALMFLGLSVLISVLYFLLERFAGYDGGSGGSVVVPMIVAMTEGQNYLKDNAEAPAKSAMWKGAVLMSVVGFVLSIAYAAIAGLTFAPDLFTVMGEISLGIWAGAAAFTFVLFILVSRLGYGLGIRAALKARK
jgi:hypothetical protein